MATIKDVARVAGVSVSSVSNVLNNKVNVSNDVYVKVTGAIEKLNYNPNFMASNLKTKNTKLVAVIFPEINEYYSQMLKGIQSVLDEKNLFVIIKVTNNSGYNENEIITELVNMRVSAIIAVSSNVDDVSRYEWALSKNVLIVLLDRYFGEYDFNAVIFNNYALVRELALKLTRQLKDDGDISNGIALLCSKESFSDELDCKNGYIDAMRESDVEPVILQTSMNGEMAANYLLREFAGMDRIPKHFIVTTQTIANSLYKILDFLAWEATIYCLAGNQWLDVQTKGGLKYIHRDPISIGESGGKLLLENMKSPLVFQNRKVFVDLETSMTEKRETVVKSTAKTKALKVLMLNIHVSDPIINLYKAFSNETGLKLDIDLKDYDGVYDAIISESMKEGKDYDVFILDYPWYETLVEMDALLKLNPYLEKTPDLLDGLMDEVVGHIKLQGGSIYAIPYFITTQFLYYRKDIFNDADIKWEYYRRFGVPLQAPKNWAEFETIAEYFTREYNPGSPVEYGTVMEALSDTGVTSEFLPRQWGFYGKVFSERKGIEINSYENKRALSSLKNAYQFSPKECINYDFRYGRDLFLNGDIAMQMAFATHIPQEDLKNGKIDYNKIGFTSIPGQCPVRGGFMLGVNKHTEQPENSFELVKWVNRNDVATYITLLGGLSPRNAVIRNSQLSKTYPWVFSVLGIFKNSRERGTLRDSNGGIVKYGLAEKVIADGVRRTLLDNGTIDENLLYMKNEIEKLVYA